MGQSVKSANGRRSNAATGLVLSVFQTDLGWIGLLGRDRRLCRLTVGHASANEVRQAVKSTMGSANAEPIREEDWNPRLKDRLQQFAAGAPDEFEDVLLDLPPLTTFQSTVLKMTRRIGYGATLSYGDLAAKAGHPRAARAVGSVMSANRFPIIIPCHRVIGCNRKLGGYSAPSGTELKQRLLDLEAKTIEGN